MRLAMGTVVLPETGRDVGKLCFEPETTLNGGTEELSSTFMASCEVRLLLATAAAGRRETLHDDRSSSSSTVSLSSASRSTSRSKSASPCLGNDCPKSFPSKLVLVRARTQRLRENSIKVLEASKRSLQERQDEHFSSSLMNNYVKMSFDTDTVGTLSSRSASEDSSIEKEIMALSHGRDETETTQHLWLRHSYPLVSLVKKVEPHEHDETFNPILQESSLKTIPMQLEADCRDIRRRHQWILLSALLVFILVGRVCVLAICSLMAGKELLLSVGAVSLPLPANPAVTSSPTSVAVSHKSPVVGRTSSRLDDPNDDDDTTMMMQQHSSCPLQNLHKIVFNTKHDSLGMWLR
jgi:hypothetical protein